MSLNFSIVLHVHYNLLIDLATDNVENFDWIKILFGIFFTFFSTLYKFVKDYVNGDLQQQFS